MAIFAAFDPREEDDEVNGDGVDGDDDSDNDGDVAPKRKRGKGRQYTEVRRFEATEAYQQWRDEKAENGLKDWRLYVFFNRS